METLAPLRLAEEWDNVGLLVGNRKKHVTNVMTCLTITPASCAEAIEKEAELVIAHHPLPFRPLKRLTTDTTAGSMLLDMIKTDIAIYSPHTSFDSALTGINQQIASGLGLEQVEMLNPLEEDVDQLGSGRIGSLPAKVSIRDFCETVKSFFGIPQLQYVGKPDQNVSKVAIACGSAGQFMQQAIRKGCDAFVTGETNFHTCLEAEATGTLLVLPGHFATERFALEWLAQQIKSELPELNVWASNAETDPIQLI